RRCGRWDRGPRLVVAGRGRAAVRTRTRTGRGQLQVGWQQRLLDLGLRIFGTTRWPGRSLLICDQATQQRSYRAFAVITENSVRADLGPYGMIDVVLNRSGWERTVRWPCGGRRETYEPATYVGTIEFRGDESFSRARQASAPLLPFAAQLPDDCDGSGSGEA